VKFLKFGGFLEFQDFAEFLENLTFSGEFGIWVGIWVKLGKFAEFVTGAAGPSAKLAPFGPNFPNCGNLGQIGPIWPTQRPDNGHWLGNCPRASPPASRVQWNPDASSPYKGYPLYGKAIIHWPNGQ
jgi:hypothetical protein